MEKAQLLKGLTILYDESEKEKLNMIVNFIKKYQFMFTYFDNGNNNETINIDSFNNLVERIIMQFIKEESIKNTIESDDFLPSMYLSYLILKKSKTNDTIIKLPSNLNIELILFFLSIKYYNYDVSKICKALFSTTFTEYEEIINHIKNEQRINIYNYYLKCASNFLEEFDTSMIDNLELIIEKLTQKYTDYMSFISLNNSKLNNLKPLSKEKFNKLFIDFLYYIDAPQKWFELYIQLRNNNLINFKFSTDIENGKCSFDDDEKKWMVKLISDGTIRTFVTFVHEFAHYVSLSQNDNINFSLLEFPPIYFENIAAEFLKDNGYDEGIIEETLNRRNSNSFSLFGSQISQLKDILSYKKNGPFSIEKKVEFYKNWLKEMNELKINMMERTKSNGEIEIPKFLQTLEEIDPVEIVYSEIDSKIEELVESGLLVLNGYQYLVGSLLSFNILDKTNRKDSNRIMIDVTNQLSNYTIDSIVKIFGINLSSDQNNINEKSFQKKLVPNSMNSN